MRNKTELTVKANQSNRTFTIRTYLNGKLISKYRTFKMTQEEFDVGEMNTSDDWGMFLKSGNYYSVL